MKTMQHKRTALSLALLPLLAAPLQATQAQENAAIGRASALEEIVVTAQRRQENLQSVPIAVTALGAQDIQQLRITNINDLSSLAPNLSVATSGQQTVPVVSIRGVVSGVSDNAVDPKVGDFQESCHPLAAIQAAFVDGSARVGSGSSGGLLIHTSSG